MDDKIIELAKKLHALAERGVDGEKEAAAKMLDRMMKKHKLTMEMLIGSDVKEHKFKVLATDKKFFIQIVASIMGRNADLYSYVNEKGKYRNLTLNCTAADAVLVEAKFAFFKKAYEKEQAVFYRAFIQQNRLYTKPDDNDEGEDDEPLTPEQKAELYRMAQMMQGMDRHIFTKQIGNG